MSKRIVWIDDEYPKIALVVKPLREARYEIRPYRTYGEVMEDLAMVRSADLLIVDLIIPPGRADVDRRYLGVELLKTLRALGMNQPVIVMSVVRSGAVQNELCQVPGIVKFINKNSPEPIEEDLLETVRATIGD